MTAKEKFENQWFPIFKAGTHRDAKGRKVTKTTEDLDEIIRNFKSSEEKPPLVIGHPGFDAPRYGTVASLKREGGVLFAKAADVYEKFAQAVSEKLFPKRSVALKGNTLKHLGFGGYYPAVQGMPDLEFSLLSDEEGDVLTFEEESLSREHSEGASFFKRFMHSMKAYFSEEEMTEKKQDKQEITDEKEHKDQVDLEALKSENEALKKEKNHLSERVSKLEKKMQEQEQNTKEKEVSDFCDSLISQGRMAPAEKEEHLTIMNALRESADNQFSEGEKDSNKGTPFEQYKKRLSERPVNFVLGKGSLAQGKPVSQSQQTDAEKFGENVDEENLELFEAARDIVEKENISFEEAVERVKGDN